VVAPGVRFKAFAIFVTPSFAFAIVFIWRLSPAVHARRATFFALANYLLQSFVARRGFYHVRYERQLKNPIYQVKIPKHFTGRFRTIAR